MRPPPNYTDFDEDDPPYLLGIEQDGATVWRLLLDYRFMDSKYFDEASMNGGVGGGRYTVAISDEVLVWLQENDPDYSVDVPNRDSFVVRFTSEVPAMGFRLRYDARITVDTPSNREMFGIRPEDEIDHSQQVDA